jgi:lipopolysaccharide export system protein LptA
MRPDGAGARRRSAGRPIVAGLAALVALSAPVVRAAEPAARPPAQQDLFQSLSLGSRKEPIQIDADGLELDYRASRIRYQGNVKVRQGDVTLESDALTILYDAAAPRGARPDPAPAASPGVAPAAPAVVAAADPGAGRIKEIVAEGNVRIRQGQRLAQGRRAVFNREAQTIVLSDHAVLNEGLNKVAGERVVVYLKEERSVVEGGGSRVTAVLYPGSEDEGAKPAEKPAVARQGAPPTGGTQ